jgi:hypothetical protein
MLAFDEKVKWIKQGYSQFCGVKRKGNNYTIFFYLKKTIMKKLFFTLLLSAYCLCIHAQTLTNSSWSTNLPGAPTTFYHYFALDTLSISDNGGVDYFKVAVFEENGDTLTVQDITPLNCMTSEIGVYTFSIVNDTLVFTTVSDPCGNRNFAFQQGTWVKSQTYVNQAATGNNNGTSCENAYTTLHDALENYKENDVIWVAAGTYLPENLSAWSDDTKRTFYLHQNVSIYGGFNGTETALDQRDPAANVNILSGDIDEDDIANDFDNNRADNVNNVVVVDTLSIFSVLDGFTISGGQANDEIDFSNPDFFKFMGSAIYGRGVLHLSNCTIEASYSIFNAAVDFSGFATAGSSVRNCLFHNNRSENAVAALSFGFTRDIILDSCQFLNNEVVVEAGGAFGVAGSSASISNCLFKGNSSGKLAGAIVVSTFGFGGMEVSVTNCDFEENSSNHGGAVYFTLDGDGNNNFQFSDCTFKDNTALASPLYPNPDGGALGIEYTGGNPSNDTIILTNCLLENNTAANEGGGIAFFNDFGTDNYFELNNVEIIGNTSESEGGGFYLSNGGGSGMEVKVTDCLIENNAAEVRTGGIMVRNTAGMNNQLLIDQCEIFNNTSNGGVGGMFITEEGNTTTYAKISNTNFKGNSALVVPGFVVTYDVDSIAPTSREIELINCLFSEHHTNNPQSAVVGTKDSEITLTNCTVANNETPSVGIIDGGKINLQSTILQSNGISNLSLGGMAVLGEMVSLGGNLISDDALDAVLNDTDQSSDDPLFEVGTFQLSDDSPAVDAGFITDEVPEFDLAGNARVQGGCLDIGAYESPYDSGESCVTGVKELLVNAAFLEIYPNPVSDQLQISIENKWQGALQLQVVNTLGQTVLSISSEKNATNFSQQINVTELPVGIYRLLVSDGEEMMVQAFVKQ